MSVFFFFLVLDLGPGPGAYSPEQCLPMNHSRRAPAYSIKSKGQPLQILEGPGPNAYTIPTCIGPRIPDKRAQAAYTMCVNFYLIMTY